jgi:lipopolysaccharide/colanic/teichoic acid biosynthesis glycosyltransferase
VSVDVIDIRKRAFDLSLSVPAFVLLLPVLVLIGVGVKVSSRGTIFFRQERVGRYGRPFRIWKFRTMSMGAEKRGLAVTSDRDARITPLGRVLRKWKLDELPQVINVICGEMSIVGPRPEVPRFVALYNESQMRVLELRPGITDFASIEFRRESELLATQANPEEYYVQVCMPKKIELNLKYRDNIGLWTDIVVIARTLVAVLGG